MDPIRLRVREYAAGLVERYWPGELARTQQCVRCARQPATLYGSPETLIESGVETTAKITGAWADAIAASVEQYDHQTHIDRALERGAAGINVAEFVTAIHEQMMRGLMLGALDAEWEAATSDAVALPRFAVRIPDGFVPPPASPGFVARPYAKAVEWFRAKQVLPRPQFDALSDAAKRKAFTVANMTKRSMLLATREELAKRVTEGADLRDFRRFAKDRLISAGWTPANPSHVETIYRTNVVGTYGAGRYAQMTSPATLALRPYWQIVTVNDGPPRQRPTHRAVHLWVLRADDPIWAKLWTPFGFSCRCRIRSLSQAQVTKQGLIVHVGSEIRDLPDPGFTSGVGSMLGPVLQPVKQLPPAPATPPPGYRPKLPTEPPSRVQPMPSERPADFRPKLPAEPPERLPPAIPRQAEPIPNQEWIPKPPPPPPPLAPSVTRAEEIMAHQIAGPKGSNPGGLYRGADGVERYVKLYSDPAQAANEHLANQIYRDLGLHAPESEVFDHGGDKGYASKIIPGLETLDKKFTPANAKKAMQGFSADVLLGNWDAAGLSLDNMAMSGSKLYRVDNGGSLLFRAKAGRKPDAVLSTITEWEGFFDPYKNSAYAKVAAKAGVHSAEEIDGIEKQIQKILALKKKSGGWADYVSKHAPQLSPADSAKVKDMLNARTKLLEHKLAEIKAAKAAAKAPGAPAATSTLPKTFAEIVDFVEAHTLKTLDMSPGQAATAQTALNALPSREASAIRSFSGSAYSSMRAADRGLGNEMTRDFNAAMSRLPKVAGSAYRGVAASDAEIAKMLAAGRLEVGAMSSFSRRAKVSVERFAIPNSMGSGKRPLVFRFIDQDEARSIESISHFESETELILPKSATQYEIVRVAKTRWQWAGKDVEVVIVDAHKTTAGAVAPHKLSSRHGY